MDIQALRFANTLNSQNPYHFVYLNNNEEWGKLIGDLQQQSIAISDASQKKNLAEIRLNFIHLNHQSLRNFSFSKASLIHCAFNNVIFANCNFDEVYFEGCVFTDCTFDGCTFHRVIINESQIEQTIFEACYGTAMRLENVSIQSSNLTRFRMESVLFRDSIKIDPYLSKTRSQLSNGSHAVISMLLYSHINDDKPEDKIEAERQAFERDSIISYIITHTYYCWNKLMRDLKRYYLQHQDWVITVLYPYFEQYIWFYFKDTHKDLLEQLQRSFQEEQSLLGPVS